MPVNELVLFPLLGILHFLWSLFRIGSLLLECGAEKVMDWIIILQVEVKDE